MREIKFRAKDITTNAWQYGYYTENSVLRGDGVPCIQDSQDDYHVYKNTLGEYTNMKDRNCQDIYEGDIVTLPIYTTIEGELVYTGTDYCIVTYEVRRGSFCLQSIHDDELLEISEIEPDSKVVGNIYDNPELLHDVSITAKHYLQDMALPVELLSGDNSAVHNAIEAEHEYEKKILENLV